MATVKQLIERDLAGVALTAPEFAETAIHYHYLADGTLDAPVTIPCCVIRDREEGSNENQIDGSGRELDNLEGRRIRASYSIIVPNDLDIGLKDYFELDDGNWFFVRPLDRDSDPQGTKRILVVQVTPDFTRAPRLRSVGASSRHGAMG